MIMLTPAEFEDEMLKISEITDDEDLRHQKADDLMCMALKDNGYISGVKIFEEMPKSY